MHLVRLHVENFRSLREAKVEFSPTTVLVGENDAGVGLLLQALTIALGAGAGPGTFALREADLRRGGDGSPSELRIELGLAPSHPGEWQRPLHRPLQEALLGGRAAGRALRFELRARAAGAGEPAVSWALHAADGTTSSAPELLAWLRRALPLVDLSRGGLLAVREDAGTALRDAAARDTDDGASAALRASHRRWLASPSPLDDESWQAVYPDVERLWLEVERSLLPMPAASPWLAAEFGFGPEASRDVEGPSPARAVRGSERIALMLLVGAAAQASAGLAEADASPLLVLGEPEAHLHPATFASVLALLGRTRAQKVVSTHSARTLAWLPLSAIRRVVRDGDRARVFHVPPQVLSREHLRKIRYHLLTRRPDAFLARCWLLVEGETETWLLPEFARHLGSRLPLEGVELVEYAQCGLPPLLKLARFLGIEWYVLTDGDRAGTDYARIARGWGRADPRPRVTELEERDVESCLWRHGYARVLARLAGSPERYDEESEAAFARRALHRALDRHGKPQVALRIIEALSAARSPGVPPPIAAAIEAAVRLAREQPLLRDARW